MLNIQCDKNSIEICHTGHPELVAAELAVAVAAIYNSYKTKDDTVAEYFRNTFFVDIMPDSPVWDSNGQVTIVKPTKKGGAPTGQS